MNSLNSRMAVMRRYGIQRETNPLTGRKCWVVRCDCGTDAWRNWKAEMPPEAMLKFFGHAGWELSTRNNPRCPACVAARHERTEEPVKHDATIHQLSSALPASEPQEAQAPINPKLMRAVYTTLDEAFNEKTRRYGEGWSDQKVAEVTGASLVFVERIRREAYGEIAEDPEIVNLRADVENLRNQLKQVEDFILTETTKRIAGIAKSVEAVGTRLAKIERKV